MWRGNVPNHINFSQVVVHLPQGRFHFHFHPPMPLIFAWNLEEESQEHYTVPRQDKKVQWIYKFFEATVCILRSWWNIYILGIYNFGPTKLFQCCAHISWDFSLSVPHYSTLLSTFQEIATWMNRKV